MNINLPIKECQGNKPLFVVVMINTLICYAFMLAFLLFFSFLVTYADIPDFLVSPAVLIFTVISIMLSGIITAKQNKTKGWLCGGIAGIFYMIILMCIGGLAYNNFSIGINTISMLLVGVFSGIFGGIVGVNMKNNKRR